MSKYSENRKSRVNPETSEVEVETFFHIDPTTIEEDRALYTEEEVKYLRETYGGFLFDKKLHKFGSFTYTCGRMFFTEEESQVTERVYQTDSKHEQRELEKQEKNQAEVVSFESLSYTDDEGYLECNIPDLRDHLSDALQDDQTAAIIKALHNAKERYVPIFLLMLQPDYGTTKIATELGMKKQTVSDDMKAIRKIAQEIYFS